MKLLGSSSVHAQNKIFLLGYKLRRQRNFLIKLCTINTSYGINQTWNSKPLIIAASCKIFSGKKSVKKSGWIGPLCGTYSNHCVRTVADLDILTLQPKMSKKVRSRTSLGGGFSGGGGPGGSVRANEKQGDGPPVELENQIIMRWVFSLH